MAIARKRTRLVSFRVDDEEYERLLTTCRDQGARSLSDLARLAIFRLSEDGAAAARSPMPHEDLSTAILMLHERVRELEDQVGRLAREGVLA